MEVCVERKAKLLAKIAWLQETQELRDHGVELGLRRQLKLYKVAFLDAHKRTQAFQSFRDSIFLLLRDLSDR